MIETAVRDRSRALHRARGLKYFLLYRRSPQVRVAPFTGRVD